MKQELATYLSRLCVHHTQEDPHSEISEITDVNFYADYPVVIFLMLTILPEPSLSDCLV